MTDTADNYINLATIAGQSVNMLVGPTHTRLAVMITPSSTAAWAGAVVSVQWNLDPDFVRWCGFPTAFEMSSTNVSFPRIPVFGLHAVRLKVTTAGSGSPVSSPPDAAAVYDWRLS